MNPQKTFKQIISVYGLEKHIPREIIRSSIIPYLIHKPAIVCLRCNKVMHTNKDIKNKNPMSWAISFNKTHSIINCINCFNSIKTEKNR